MQRFWDKIEKTETCWNWIGAQRNGYGAFKFQGKVQDTHRVSWILHFGDIPKGKYICHHCDNRKCVNPQHLFLGTQKDNIVDAIKKGRFIFPTKTQIKKGHIPKSRKLTLEKAKEIRKKYIETKISQRALAKEYGVDRKAIWMLLHNNTWYNNK